jgi:hypothetical protein
MTAPDRGLLGSAPAVGNDPGAALRAARKEAGLTAEQLADLVEGVRRRRGLPEIQHESIRRQIFGLESGKNPVGPLWRSLCAGALRIPEERLFGPPAPRALPSPMLASMHVTEATVESLLRQRALHAENEHIFGPLHVQRQAYADLQVVNQLLVVTPAKLRHDMHRAATSFAELFGWIAQDSGYTALALHHTVEALGHLDVLNHSDPGLKAMLMMRRSNIITTSDPRTALEYAEVAAELAESVPTGRLHASIGRQQALAALAAGEERAFNEHVAYALELAQADKAEDDLAAYATRAYVVSETPPGLIRLKRADEAAEQLIEHLPHWPDGQQRDQGVAQLRLVRALAVAGDYGTAVRYVDEAISAWKATPSARARQELQAMARLLRDRSRGRPPLPLNQLRGQIKAALQGGSVDG